LLSFFQLRDSAVNDPLLTPLFLGSIAGDLSCFSGQNLGLFPPTGGLPPFRVGPTGE